MKTTLSSVGRSGKRILVCLRLPLLPGVSGLPAITARLALIPCANPRGGMRDAARQGIAPEQHVGKEHPRHRWQYRPGVPESQGFISGRVDCLA